MYSKCMIHTCFKYEYGKVYKNSLYNVFWFDSFLFFSNISNEKYDSHNFTDFEIEMSIIKREIVILMNIMTIQIGIRTIIHIRYRIHIIIHTQNYESHRGINVDYGINIDQHPKPRNTYKYSIMYLHMFWVLIYINSMIYIKSSVKYYPQKL